MELSLCHSYPHSSLVTVGALALRLHKLAMPYLFSDSSLNTGLTCSPPEPKRASYPLLSWATGLQALPRAHFLSRMLLCPPFPGISSPIPGVRARDSGHCLSLVLLLCSSGAREAEGCRAAQHVTVLQPQKGIRQRNAEQGLPG